MTAQIAIAFLIVGSYVTLLFVAGVRQWR